MKIPFVGPAYESRSVNVNAQTCLNLYPEIDKQDAKNTLALYPTPGLTEVVTSGLGPNRGNGIEFKGKSYWVSGGAFMEIDAGFVAVQVGVLNTSGGQITMAQNGSQIIIVDSLNGYIYDGTALTQITDPDFPNGATHVDFIDGYFIVNNPGTGQFHISASYDGTAWNALDFATAERNPDDILALIVNYREVWLFGKNTAEVWFNSGAEFPFDPVRQGFSEWGIAAAFSVSTITGSLIWLSSNERGQGLVMLSQGYTPTIISTRAIEAEFSTYSQIDDAISYAYQQQGHHFYVLTFPVANKTWVYDVVSQVWHERGTSNLGRHRSVGHLYYSNTNLVGDYATGKIFELDLDSYTDDGVLIERVRRTQHIHKDLRRIIYHVMQVDMETGTGLVSGQGSDPQVMLRWSDDGGHTWSSELWRSMGKIGEYRTRAIWRRLGKSRDRIFELKVTDPVKTVVIDARADITVCSS